MAVASACAAWLTFPPVELAPGELPRRLVAALIRDEVAPLPPPRAAPLEDVTVPVWLKDDIVAADATDDVDLTVMLLFTPMEPP